VNDCLETTDAAVFEVLYVAKNDKGQWSCSY